MKKKKIKIHFSEDLLTKNKLKTLVLDTSFFIDALHHIEAFTEFANECRKNDITLVTIQPVVIEYTSGSESEDDYNKKLEFIKSFVYTVLPLPPKILEEVVPQLVKEYKKDGASVSLTDYLLAGTLRWYKNDVILLTKNPKDFPNVFTLCGYIVLEMKKALQIYGMYSALKQDVNLDIINEDVPF